MAKRLSTPWRASRAALVLGGLLTFIPLSWILSAPRVQAARCLPPDSQPDPTNPDLDCPAPPNTFDVSPFFASNADSASKAAAGPTWDAWAWATFAALNWPAKSDVFQPSGYQRGVPATTRDFLHALSTDVAVWETFKEKRELFNDSITESSSWQAITFLPAQQPMSSTNQTGLQACSAADSAQFATAIPPRILFQGTKTSSVPSDNTLDEVVEVASPAQELAALLCEGFDSTTNPTHAACVTTIFPDSVNTDTLNRRTPVGPRVWKGDPGSPGNTAQPVLFEVKVNYDFWNYIIQNRFYDDSIAYGAARDTSRSLHPKLPFRTSSAQGPGRNPNAQFNYEANTVASQYQSLAHPDTLPRIGSVQIKVAWLLLGPNDDPTSYHTTDAVYYRSLTDSTQCYEVDTFGLIGLHIIQRVHAFQASRQPTEYAEFAHGGTFVFATWEHISLPDSGIGSGYYYANFLASNTNLLTNDSLTFSTNTVPFPNFLDSGTTAIPVVRAQAYPLATTQAVNDSVHASISAVNPTSVWLNYRLVGTQFVAVSSDSMSLTYNQPYYLANLVVETNKGLQHFQGLPPNVTVTPYYAGDTTGYQGKVTIMNTRNGFRPLYPNVIFNREQRQPAIMGGCMGCHGVAQLLGYNFSFVFQDGQKGSVLDTQTHFDIAPDKPSPERRGGGGS